MANIAPLDSSVSSLAQTLGPMAKEATRLMKVLAHPARLVICCQLKAGEMSVGALETTLGIHQPRLSRELAKLREAGVLETRRDAKVIFYRLADDRARALIEALCDIMLGPSSTAGGLS